VGENPKALHIPAGAVIHSLSLASSSSRPRALRLQSTFPVRLKVRFGFGLAVSTRFSPSSPSIWLLFCVEMFF
jgi:hypothetical protein